MSPEEQPVMKFEQDDAVIINGGHEPTPLTKEDQTKRRYLALIYLGVMLAFWVGFPFLIPPIATEGNPQIPLESWGDATYSITNLSPLSDGGYFVQAVMDEKVEVYTAADAQSLGTYLLGQLTEANHVDYRYVYLKLYSRFEEWEDGTLLPDYEQYLIEQQVIPADGVTNAPSLEALIEELPALKPLPDSF